MTATQLGDASREIGCTRVYKAPKDLLIRMWSNPEHISHWWGPHGFTTTTHALEFKTDGIWKFTMHGPDGTDYPSVIRYTHVSTDRIEYEQTGANDLQFIGRIDFEEVEAGTQMRFFMTFPNAEVRREVERFGAVEGLDNTVSRLGEYVSEQDPNALEVVIVRQFDAPQERVWKALIEPDQLRQWFGPIALRSELTKDDARVGGKWNLVMSNDFGVHVEVGGEYVDIDPMRFIKMTHRYKKKNGSFWPTTSYTYNLHMFEGKTILTLVHSGFWAADWQAEHVLGWDSSLHRLAVLTGATKADRALTLEREFDAPIDLVWRCWTEAERVKQWFAPRPYTCPKCDLELVPGGKFTLVMRSPDGDEHVMSAIITNIDLNSKIEWLFSAPDQNGEKAIQGGTTVTFEDLSGRTRIRVETYASALTDAGIFMIGGMEQGWNMTLDQMVESALAAV